MPELKLKDPGTRYSIVEGTTVEDMRKTLDTLAGIDAWQVNQRGMRGLASRIQYIDRQFFFGRMRGGTFTVRKKRESNNTTEYQKRSYAIKNNYLYPYHTLQAYFDKAGDLIDFAVAKTEDIMFLIDEGFYETNRTGRHQNGQAEFYVVYWSDISDCNFDIYIHSEYNPQRRQQK